MLGDSGVLTAIRLARHADVVGISVKPALVSGQELGLRISRPRAWARIQGRLTEAGVILHRGHRALLRDGFAADRITSEPVRWSTGQPPATADAVLWAIGRVRPNTDWLPTDVLDDHGFVRVTSDLRVPDHPGVFAVGDVAATDPLRASARNRADKLLARNIRAEFARASTAACAGIAPKLHSARRSSSRHHPGVDFGANESVMRFKRAV